MDLQGVFRRKSYLIILKFSLLSFVVACLYQCIILILGRFAQLILRAFYMASHLVKPWKYYLQAVPILYVHGKTGCAHALYIYVMFSSSTVRAEKVQLCLQGGREGKPT